MSIHTKADALLAAMDAAIASSACVVADAEPPFSAASLSDGKVDVIRAAGIIFVCGDKALFLQRNGDFGDHGGEWSWPGGKIEDGESAEEAARRECIEEIGSMPKGPMALHARRISTGVSAVLGDETIPSIPAVPPVDFTTFIVKVRDEFEPTLNEEHTGYAWCPIVSPPQPMHPDAAAALAKLSMNEYDIAVAIMSGELTSPQQFMNIWLFDMRITGTGMAFRKRHDEFVYRNPDDYLTDYFLRRCAGLTVIIDHPPDDTLDSSEFKERNIGNIVLPYIKGEEVWGIAKIYDAAAAMLMKDRQLSTSPAVVFRPGDGNKEQIVDGAKVLVEGRPSLLDHLAVCVAGVWDKGGAPSGIVSTRGDSDVAEKTETEKKADGELSSMMDSFRADMKECVSKMDSVSKRMDEWDEKEKKAESARKDAEEKARKDAESEKEREEAAKKDKAKKDSEKSEEEKKADAEREEKERADKARKDAESEKEREEAAKKDAARSDAASIESLRADIARLSKMIPAQITDADRAQFADAQARADVAFSAFSERAPSPLLNEALPDYRRRLAGAMKQHSKNWKDADLISMKDDASFEVVERQIYSDAIVAARNPVDVPFGQLRPMVRMDGTGTRPITEYAGDPRSWLSQFGGRPMQVKNINRNPDRLN